MHTFYDVVVYGGTSAGVVSAVQAARMGMKVALLEPGEQLGGMTSSGLTATDVANYMVIGGMAREFYHRIYKFYLNQAHWKYESQSTYMDRVKRRVWGGGDELTKMRWVFEPHAAELIFNEMLDEAGVYVFYREHLDLNYGVVKIGDRIHSIRMESGVTYTAKVFIDATYEGDLLAASGVSYTVGREANELYGETLNGIQRASSNSSIDPYIVQGNRRSGLLPFVDKAFPERDGTGDQRVQAYTFRLTLTDEKDNQIPIEKPAHYNPLLYEVKARQIMAQITAGKPFMPDQMITFTPMPNRKTDTNSIDYIGASYSWPEGNYEKREQIWKEHQLYVQGLLWFLGNDPRIPEPARMEMKRWGLAADEYMNHRHWPSQLYVREARRMVSDAVMTEHHLKRNETVQDVIGMGSYAIDCHTVRYYVEPNGKLGKEGDLMVGVRPYPISYRALIPRETECKNLVTPTCPSSTHVAFSSIRMEPTFMILAQAAGTIAALAVQEESPVQRLSYRSLREQLEQDGQILSLNIAEWNDRYARYLFDLKVIESLEPWHRANEDELDPVSLKGFLVAAANRFRPPKDVIEALQILHHEGIQPSRAEHWLEVVLNSSPVPRESANQLMRDIARRIANYEKYSVLQT